MNIWYACNFSSVFCWLRISFKRRCVYLSLCSHYLLGIPVIPLSIASIPILIMMRFTGFAKNRDNFKYFTGVLALVLAVGVSVFMQKYAVNLADASALLGLIESSRQTVTGIGNIIPGVSFAVNALTNYQSAPGILNLFLFLICVSLLYFVFVLFGKAFYLTVVESMNLLQKEKK